MEKWIDMPRTFLSLFSLGLLVLPATGPLQGEDASAAKGAEELFRNKVFSILEEKCFRCHGERKQKSDLRLDSAEALEKGGEFGPIIDLENPEQSTIVLAVRREGELKMPPSDPLSPEEVEAIVEWVKGGAPYPDVKVVKEEDEPPEEPGDDAVAVDGHKEWVTALDFAPDGSSLATSGGEPLIIRAGSVRIFDPVSGKEVDAQQGHSGPIWSVRFSPDGTMVATAGYDKLVKLWELERGAAGSGTEGTVELRERATLEGHENWVTCLAFSPDGRLLASGSEDSKVKLWDVEASKKAGKGKEAASLEGHEATVRSVTFSPDGSLLASAGFDKKVKLWNVEKKEAIATLEGHEDAVWAVAFSPGGDLLASGGADNKIKLWNIASEGGKVDVTERATLDGHKNWVTSLSFSPDGIYLASGSYDRTAKLWNVFTHREAATLKRQESAVWCVRFTPDGTKLYLGTGSKTGEEETLLLWSMDVPRGEVRTF